MNFSYIIDGQLAGSARPGLWGSVDQDLGEARASGIRAVVSLTERGLGAEAAARHGLAYLHLPVPDFHPPTLRQIESFVRFTGEQLEKGDGAVLVHCQAGMGRTGTMLAAYLVSTGMGANEAIETIRDLRPGSVETYSQEAIVHEWAELLEAEPKKRGDG